MAITITAGTIYPSDKGVPSRVASPRDIRRLYPQLESLAKDMESLSKNIDRIVQDLSRISPIISLELTGAVGTGTPTLGTNCPAVDPTTPFTWIQTTLPDGSVVYIPAWK